MKVELKENVTKESMERLQKELVSKSSKLVTDVTKFNRSELIEGVDVRTGATLSAPGSPTRQVSGPSPMQVSGPSSMTDVTQLILLMFKEKERPKRPRKKLRES